MPNYWGIGMACSCPLFEASHRAPGVQLRQSWAYVQLGDVADGAGIEGAVALDARVEIGVAVQAAVVDGDAAAGLAADVPVSDMP